MAPPRACFKVKIEACKLFAKFVHSPFGRLKSNPHIYYQYDYLLQMLTIYYKCCLSISTLYYNFSKPRGTPDMPGGRWRGGPYKMGTTVDNFFRYKNQLIPGLWWKVDLTKNDPTWLLYTTFVVQDIHRLRTTRTGCAMKASSRQMLCSYINNQQSGRRWEGGGEGRGGREGGRVGGGREGGRGGDGRRGREGREGVRGGDGRREGGRERREGGRVGRVGRREGGREGVGGREGEREGGRQAGREGWRQGRERWEGTREREGRERERERERVK